MIHADSSIPYAMKSQSPALFFAYGENAWYHALRRFTMDCDPTQQSWGLAH